MPRKRRRWARLVLAISLTLALLVGLLAAGLFPQGSLRRFVERRLREALGPATRLDDLHIVPGSLRGEIRGLVLEGPTYRLEIPRARVKVTLDLLLSGRLSFERVEAEGARLVVRAPATPSPTTEPLPEVRVAHLRLTDSEIRYQDPELSGEVVLRGVDADGAIGTGAIDLRVERAVWQRPSPLVFTPIQARVALSPDLRLRLESLQAATAHSRLQAEGEVGDIQAPELDVRFSLWLDLAEMATLAASPTRLEGQVELRGALKGPAAAMQVEADAAGQRLRIEQWPIDAFQAKATVDGAPPRRFQGTLSASLLGGGVQAQAQGQETTLQATLTGHGLRAERLPAAVRGQGGAMAGALGGKVHLSGDLERTLAVTADLSGQAAAAQMQHAASVRAAGSFTPRTGQLDLGWQGRVDSLAAVAAGELPLRRSQLMARGRARGTFPAQAGAQVEAEIWGEARVALPSGQEQSLALRGSASGGGDRVRAALQAEGPAGVVNARLDARGPRVETLEVTGRALRLDALAPEAAGQLDLSAQASGPWRRLSGQASATASGVAWRGVEAGTVELEAGLQGGAGQAHLAAPALRVSGEAQWTPQADFTGRLVLDEAPLAPLEPLLGPEVDGRVSGEAQFRGQADRLPETEVTAEVTQAEVVRKNTYAQLTAPARFEVRGRRAHISALELEAQGARLSAQGDVPLQPAGQFDLQVRAQGPLDALELPNAWDVSGDVDGSAHVQGTWSRPQVAGEAAVRDLIVVSPAAGDALAASHEVRARFDGEHAVIDEAVIAVGGGELLLSADVPLAGVVGQGEAVPAHSPASRVRVQADWAEIDAGVLAAAAGRGRSTLEALLSGRLELEAPLAASAGVGLGDEVRGRLEMDAVTARVRDLALQVSPVRVDVQSGQATLLPVQVTSAGSRLDLQGSADLKARTVHGSGQGQLDLRALDPLLEQATLTGVSRLDVKVDGPIGAPQGEGSIVVEDATLRLQEIPQALSSIQGTARLSGNTLRLEGLSAQLGGGTLNLTGSARLSQEGLREVSLQGSARDVSLRYPRDFKSRVHADVRLTGRSGDLLLSGQVRAERGLYDTDIDLLAEAFRDRPAEPVAPPSPLLATVSLDLEAFTENPILIRNNLARIEATGRLRVRGDLLTPAPYGRLEVAPGGHVYLQTRDFVVDSGSLTYTGSLDPDVSVRAKTLIKEMDTDEVEVTVTAQGQLFAPEMRLSSDPSYSEQEIASLITSGRRNAAADQTAWLAGEQAALLVGGRLERRLERKFQQLGLDEVDIEPELLAREADLSARFTFAKRLTPALKLIYSTGLRDAEDRFFEAQYRFRLGRQITLKLQRNDDHVYTYGAGQRLRFGAPVRPRRRTAEERSVVGEVRFAGAPPLPEPQLRSWVRAEPGRQVTYWDLQSDAERLEKKLHDAGFVEALVTVRLDEGIATFNVRGGARYDWRVSGLSAPPNLQRELRGAFSEEEALEHGRQRLLEAAHARGYWRAQVETRVDGAGTDRRTLVFEVEPGPHITRLTVAFPGAKAFSSRKLTEAAGGKAALLQEPEEARGRIEHAYRELYYLEARVDKPRLIESETGDQVAVEVPIAEGRQAVVTTVEFPGATLDVEQLPGLANVRLGEPYDFDQSVDAAQRVRDHYLKAGYARVRVHPRPVPRGTELVLELEVHEGPRSTVGPTVISGLHRTKESLVQGRVQLKPGQPLDPRQLSVLERRLLDLDVFSRVAVSTDEQEPATIRVELEEEGPYALAYDVRYSREDKTTGTLDAEVGNLFGLGLSLGARYRAGADLREARGSLHLPSLGPTGNLTAALFETQEDFRIISPQGAVPTLAGRPFPVAAETEVQRGFQLQRATHPREGWDLLYGYRYKEITSRPERLHQNISGFEFSVVNDRRDDPLDATRGRFISLSVEASPKMVGSDFTFARFLGQVFFVRELGRDLSWAQGYRLGLARGLEQQRQAQVEVFGRSTELFRTGGANTLRGFARDSVGPPSPIAGITAGGEGLIVLNQELRYHHPWGIGAAVFWDAGNVFEHLEDFGLKLRHSVGAGLRYQSPVGLLRLDVGFPLGRRRGEGAVQWFFSVGQAF